MAKFTPFLPIFVVISRLTDHRHFISLPVESTLPSMLLARTLSQSLHMNEPVSLSKFTDILVLLKETCRDAIRSGLSGAMAGVLQVFFLMWLRTTLHFQHRYGLSTLDAMYALYKQGGIPRFYTGITFALLQSPLSRFGSVAANTGATRLSRYIINNNNNNRMHILLTTLIGTVFASWWRFILMPIDTCKTVLQVEGSAGFTLLMQGVMSGQMHLLFEGTLATVIGAAVGHYAWFLVYNSFQHWFQLQRQSQGQYPSVTTLRTQILQNAFIGFMASIFSDILTNPIRVLKTMKQTVLVDGDISYYEVIMTIIQSDGIISLFERGLITRILSNGIQSMLFTVLWKLLTPKKTEDKKDDMKDMRTSKSSVL